MMWLSFFLLMLVSCSVVADVFLQRPAPGISEQDDSGNSNILEQLEEALGSDSRAATEVRLQDIEEALRPIFEALPKRFENYKVGPPAARYALHRLFIQRHGWQVKGLAAHGQSWAGNAVSVAFANKVPQHVRGLFDDKLNNTGLDLHELAVFASVLEHLIHSEAEHRLEAAYSFSGQVPTQVLSSKSATEVIETYMIIYLSGFNISQVGAATMKKFIANIEKIYPTWKDTQSFLEEVQHDAARDLEVYSFHDVMSVVEQAGERFVPFQNQECIDLKESLVKLEESAGSGRVRLGDFYAGSWHFSESVSYLRQLGALDESDNKNLRVIIPNYYNAPSNCIASSAYYGVCCIDQCEEIVGQLERKLRAPTALPAQVVEIVRMQLADLSLVPNAGIRTLSDALLNKLQDLASHHGGRVPIHGRLFAQWLHHVYPRECPYPHMSGTTEPKTGKEWTASGHASRVRREEREQYIEAALRLKQPSRGQAATTDGENTTDCSEDLCTAMWTMEEELVDEHAHQVVMQHLERADQKREKHRALLFLLFSCCAMASFALSLKRNLGQALTSLIHPSQKGEAQSRVCFARWSITPATHLHSV